MYALQYCYEPRHKTTPYYVERVYKLDDSLKESFIIDQWTMGAFGCFLSNGTKSNVFVTVNEFKQDKTNYKKYLLAQNVVLFLGDNGKEQWIKLEFKQKCPKFIQGYNGRTKEFEIVDWDG